MIETEETIESIKSITTVFFTDDKIREIEEWNKQNGKCNEGYITIPANFLFKKCVFRWKLPDKYFGNEVCCIFELIDGTNITVKNYLLDTSNNRLEFKGSVRYEISDDGVSVDLNGGNKVDFTGFNKEEIELMIRGMVILVPMILNYLDSIELNRKVFMDYKKANNLKSKGVNQHKSRSYNVINLDGVKVSYYDNDINKRKYNITMENWEVRGHIRNLKSGRKVFIKPYIKGNKNKKCKGQRYELD